MFDNIHCVFGGDKGCDSAQLKTVHCSVVVNINELGCMWLVVSIAKSMQRKILKLSLLYAQF